MQKPLRVLLSVDPFSTQLKPFLKSVKAVQFFFTGRNIRIVPVGVILLDKLDPKTKTFPKNSEEAEELAMENLRALLLKCDIPHCEGAEVLSNEKVHSTRAAAKALLEYAQETNASAVAVATHSYQGLSRLLLGSFAETLIMHSSIPVLITNPLAQFRSKLSTLLFPTDFSKDSRKVFETVVSLCKESGVQLHLFHVAEYLHPELSYPFIPPAVSSLSVAEYEQSFIEQGEQWAHWAELKGVATRFELSRRRGKKVSGDFEGSIETRKVCSDCHGLSVRPPFRNVSG